MSDKHGFDIGGNLRKIMLEHSINSSQLGTKLNLSAATIKKIRKGGNPTIGSLQPIADYFKISISQLIGDNKHQVSQTAKIRASKKSVTNVPLVEWKNIEDASNILFHIDSINVRYTLNSGVYATTVNDSSYSIFQEGGILFIDPNLGYKHNDYIIVKKVNQACNIKKVLEEDGEHHLQSITQGINTVVPLTSDFEVIGVIVGYNKWFKSE